MARLKGLEPLTYWFVASHSIQLSYKRIVFKDFKHIIIFFLQNQEFFKKSFRRGAKKQKN